jgi:hypothetical protein
LEIDAVDGREAILHVRTPVGLVKIMGTVTLTQTVLDLDGVHVDGPGRGRLQMQGIYAIAQKVMEELDVQEILAQGGTRTTGLRNGKRPRCFKFRRN